MLKSLPGVLNLVRCEDCENIFIDPEINALISSLKPDEFAKLRESIQNEGCRDPLVVWKGHDVLLDGHNRYAVCQELGKPFRVVELEFSDKDHAMLWILKNQLGRRNLSDFQFKLLLGREYELEKKVAWGGDRKSDTFKENQVPQSEGDDYSTETAERLAKEHNVSRATVERSADLYKSTQAVKEVAPEVAEKLESEAIKAPLKDILAVGKALKKADPEQKERLVSEIKNDFNEAIETSKDIVIQSTPFDSASDPLEAVQQWAEEQEANVDLPAIPLIVTNVLDLKGIRSMLKDKTCPCCGVPAAGKLVWKCCGSTLNESIDVAESAAHRFFEEAEAKSRASRLANGWVEGVNL